MADREDIHELTAQNGISTRICLYKPRKIIPVYREMAELIFEAATEIEVAVKFNKVSESF